MDRRIVYPQTNPQDVDILWPQRAAMTALGCLMETLFGTQTVAAGFSASVSGLTVTLGAGSLTSYGAIDVSAFGSLAANGSNIQKIGINLSGASFTISAPGTGITVGNIIEAQYVEQDTTSVVLPYYNSSGGSPFSGPSNSGAANNTLRQQTVNLQLVTNTTSPTSGWTPLYTVYATNSSGTTTLNVAQHPQAPFCPFTFPALTPGFSRMQVLNTGSGTWTVPAGVQLGRVRCWGPGGNGGAGSSTSGNAGGGGGGGGGYIEAFWSAYPQTAISYTAGPPGTASNFGSFVTAGAGGNGSASGSTGGAAGGGGGGFTLGSGTFGSYFGATGQSGGVGYQISGGAIGGSGGSAFAGGNGAIGSGFGSAESAASNGGGGAGGVGAESGGNGGGGLIIVEY